MPLGRLEVATGREPSEVVVGASADPAQREFDALPRRTQIAGMRRLAENALAAFDLAQHRLTLIAHLFNTTFWVDTATGQHYVLRIHRAGTPTVGTVGSELAWLAALRRDTTLEVPDPVQTRVGQLLTVASAPGVPNRHICVLFRWLPGKRMRRTLTPRQMDMVGAIMARLQLHAIGWTPPPDFTRGRVDHPVDRARWLPSPFSPEIETYARDLVSDTPSPAEAVPVVDTLARVRGAEATLRRDGAAGKPSFGLIHADLHYHNLIFARDTVKAIDFDDCGFGPHLYDPAVMLSEVLDWPNYVPVRNALLTGYRRVRPLPPEHEALLDTFIALRTIQDALRVLEWRVHPALGPDWPEVARRSLARLPALLAP